jgi:Mn-containing catalase
MFIHKEVPIHAVRVDEPNPVFAEKLLEQYGGATGELTAALQYFVQSQHTDDPALRDMLLDIATEEMGHLEVVGRLIEMHTAKSDQSKAYGSTLFAIAGKGPHFFDSKGSYWEAKYINEGGDPARDLRANIAAEGGALQTYENLIKMAPDSGTRDALVHLATREVSHTKMFMAALASMNKLTEPLFGDLKPDNTVDLYFNMSSDGDANQRAPWIKEPAFKYIADPLATMKEGKQG